MPDRSRALLAARPLVAVVANSLPAYRASYLRRLHAELPGYQFVLLLTHGRPEIRTDDDATRLPIEVIELAAHRATRSRTNIDLLRDQVAQWKISKQISDWLDEHQAAAVLCVGYNDPGRLRILSQARKVGRATLTFGDGNIRGDTATGIRAVAKRQWIRRIVSLSDAICCNGELGRQFFLKYGATAEQIFFTPYEPDYSIFRPDAHSDNRSMIFVGRLVNAQKRVDLLIDAFIRIAADRPNWSLQIVGDGEDDAMLKSRVPRELASRVLWRGPIADPDEMARVYRSADVLVVPSDFEPWGLVVNEAAACGLAVVASDAVGAAFEIAPDFMFPRGDLAALSRMILHVTQPDILQQARRDTVTLLARHRIEKDPVRGLSHALEYTFARARLR